MGPASILLDLVKNEEYYRLSHTQVFQTLDAFQVDATLGFKDLLAITNQEDFKLFRNNHILLVYFATAISLTCRAGFILIEWDTASLETKLRLNEWTESPLLNNAKQSILIELKECQKKYLKNG